MRDGLERASLLALLLALLAGVRPAQGTAQLSEPCKVACGLLLGATGFTVATGALVASARYTGGVSSTQEAALVWVTGLALTVSAGVVLAGNGERQERAVYASGIGLSGGALLGVALESALDGSSRQRKIAAALVGAATGALAGGLYGALSHDTGSGSSAATVIGLRLPL